MYCIGIDIGTSGIRACAVDENSQQVAMARQMLPLPDMAESAIEQDANIWWQALQQVLFQLLQQIEPAQVRAICVDGTSGTVLITDAAGTPLAPALMYNDSRARHEASLIDQHAPADSAARGSSSGLARLLYLQNLYPQARHALHQADWIAGKLGNRFGFSDANNALKSGYDVIHNKWPDWLDGLGIKRDLLPTVFLPGTCIGNISTHWANYFQLPANTNIMAGTTDSIAAFIATGASQPGEAVTSLGSTLVLKVISEQPVFAPQFGIYSHRLGNYWLAGGASNSGGAVLRQYFTDEQMQTMSSQLSPEHDTGLDYYPLPGVGERFPVNNAGLQPKLTPRPADDVTFFQGMLEAMARIEAEGYKKLQQLGAPALRCVKTAGGGSQNSAWTQIRQQRLGVPVISATISEASYGSALLALRGYNTMHKNNA